MDVAELSERGIAVAGQGGDTDAEAFCRHDNADQFIAFAAVTDGDEQIVFLDHPEVAVHGFDGVHEDRRRTGAGHCGGNLAADVSAFADAGDHDLRAGIKGLTARFHQFDEIAVEGVFNRFESFNLNGEHFFCFCQYRFGIHGFSSPLFPGNIYPEDRFLKAVFQ